MSYVILGIHGLANKPPPELLEKWWENSLLEGLKRNCGNTEQKINFKSLYWADVTYEKPLETNDEPYHPAEGTGPLKKYKDSWFSDVVAGALSAGGWTLDAAKRYLGVHHIADKVLESKLKDLSLYYENEQIREELRSRLKSLLLNSAGNRIALIAHSMGSIIAYDVLRILGRDEPDFELEHFITIGSPLGLPHVLDRIYKENHLVRTPTVVKRWSNFADRRDPVALDVHLSDDYETNDRGVKVVDDLVINGYVSPQNKPNYHKSYGYLRAPELSEVIRRFI